MAVPFFLAHLFKRMLNHGLKLTDSSRLADIASIMPVPPYSLQTAHRLFCPEISVIRIDRVLPAQLSHENHKLFLSYCVLIL